MATPTKQPDGPTSPYQGPSVAGILARLPKGCTGVLASTQYGMGFILTEQNEIVFRDDSLSHGVRKALAEEVNMIILRQCGCVAYCPRCREPLNDQASWFDPDNDGHGCYQCSGCNRISEWHFGIAPGPVCLSPNKIYHRDSSGRP